MSPMPAAVLSSFVLSDSHEHEGETHEESHPGETHDEHAAHTSEVAGDEGAAHEEVTGHEGHTHESTGSFTQDYVNLLTDPAHFAVELTFMLLGEVLIALVLLPLIKKYFNFRLAKAHAELDREHGVSHDPETGEIVKTPKS